MALTHDERIAKAQQIEDDALLALESLTQIIAHEPYGRSESTGLNLQGLAQTLTTIRKYKNEAIALSNSIL